MINNVSHISDHAFSHRTHTPDLDYLLVHVERHNPLTACALWVKKPWKIKVAMYNNAFFCSFYDFSDDMNYSFFLKTKLKPSFPQFKKIPH